MALASQAVDVTVDCTVRVARDADGTLADGAANQLARVDGVHVEDVDVAGIEPRLNDVAVDVEATVRVDVDAQAASGEETREAVRAVLGGGFGVDPGTVRMRV